MRECVASPVDWIDPELLKSFKLFAITDGDREVLVGYLDLTQFPRVEEFKRSLEQGE